MISRLKTLPKFQGRDMKCIGMRQVNIEGGLQLPVSWLHFTPEHVSPAYLVIAIGANYVNIGKGFRSIIPLSFFLVHQDSFTLVAPGVRSWIARVVRFTETKCMALDKMTTDQCCITGPVPVACYFLWLVILVLVHIVVSPYATNRSCYGEVSTPERSPDST